MKLYLPQGKPVRKWERMSLRHLCRLHGEMYQMLLYVHCDLAVMTCETFLNQGYYILRVDIDSTLIQNARDF